jgi:AmmeMemoRadiSam system protein B
MTRNNVLISLLLALLAAASLGLIFSPVKPTTKPEQPAAAHYATLMGKEFFDEAYRLMPPIAKTDQPVAGGIVNHHLLAAPLDAQFFAGLAAQKPKRIILIGPDHLSRGKRPITATSGTWKTPYGDLATDTELTAALADSHLVNIEETPFDYEFSVGGLVPFIKRSLPDAKVITIILRNDAKAKELDNLVAALPQDQNTIIVGSIDFSHYLPSDVANFHDLTNLAITSAFDWDSLDKLEIDSVPTMRAVLKYAEIRKAQTSTVVAHTNSAEATKNLDAQETTSYLNMYFSLGPKTPFVVKTALYLGDDRTPPTPSFTKRGQLRIISPEDRFMNGFMNINDGSSLPEKLKLPNLAVGIARYTDKTVYYLFPTILEKGLRRLMTAPERTAYFRQNKLNESIVTIRD